MEAKRRFLHRSQRIPPATGRLQQRIGAHDIGFNKRRRAVNRTIDMAFRSQVHHCIRLILNENTIKLAAVANIHLFKGETRILRHRRQRH